MKIKNFLIFIIIASAIAFTIGRMMVDNKKISVDSQVKTEDKQLGTAVAGEIETLFVQNIGVVTNASSTSYATALIATSTDFTANKDYFVYFHSGVGQSTVSGDVLYQIVLGSTVIDSGRVEGVAVNTGSESQIHWIGVISQGASPQNLSIKFAPNSATGVLNNPQMLIMNLNDAGTSNYSFNTFSSSFDHASTTYKNGASTTLTMADGVKDWLIFGMEKVDINNVANRFSMKLTDGTTEKALMMREGEDATNDFFTTSVMGYYQNVATNTVMTLLVGDVGSNAGTLNKHASSSIFALNLNIFEDYKVSLCTNFVATGSVFKENCNLNSGGNYQPTNTGTQIILSQWMSYFSSGVLYDDRLLVNSTTSPVNWVWDRNVTGAQGKETFDSLDNMNNTLMDYYTSFPSSGYPINLEMVYYGGTNATTTEALMVVFSKRLEPATPTGGAMSDEPAIIIE